MTVPESMESETLKPRGVLRMIFTDAGGMITPSLQRDLGDGVWALIGPIGDHTSHPDLQDALGLVCMAFNRQHGRISADKHQELFRGNERGLELLRAADLTRPTPNEDAAQPPSQTPWE